ncbi:MAG: phosphatidylethanolamine N-methyltransferase [Streblomastix strix]|uniref:Phosphatidylethanolamine N-methyltransferase n=1 Tax=Streblomastix strix TaxID=222440 RepID=A0A5J4WM45_9EUKA|nr:MAG: phosphatidylethanolamine N-methyltransferase [Streblomastix strix]
MPIAVDDQGNSFDIPHIAAMFEMINPRNASVFEWTAIFLNIMLTVLFFIPQVPITFFALFYLFWRTCYDLGIGIILHFQSKNRIITKFVQKYYNKGSGSKLTAFIDYLLHKGSKDYDPSKYPDCFNGWLLFKHLENLILFMDGYSYFLFALRQCSLSRYLKYIPLQIIQDHIQPDTSTTPLYLNIIWDSIGLFLLAVSYYSKNDAERVVGEFSWFWGDFFFLIKQDLIFDGVYLIFFHPMYLIGYFAYYSAPILARSYLVLFVGLLGHLMQMLFLNFVEQPHMNKIYGSESDKDENEKDDNIIIGNEEINPDSLQVSRRPVCTCICHRPSPVVWQFEQNQSKDDQSESMQEETAQCPECKCIHIKPQLLTKQLNSKQSDMNKQENTFQVRFTTTKLVHCNYSRPFFYKLYLLFLNKLKPKHDKQILYPSSSTFSSINFTLQQNNELIPYINEMPNIPSVSDIASALFIIITTIIFVLIPPFRYSLQISILLVVSACVFLNLFIGFVILKKQSRVVLGKKNSKKNRHNLSFKKLISDQLNDQKQDLYSESSSDSDEDNYISKTSDKESFTDDYNKQDTPNKLNHITEQRKRISETISTPPPPLNLQSISNPTTIQPNLQIFADYHEDTTAASILFSPPYRSVSPPQNPSLTPMDMNQGSNLYLNYDIASFNIPYSTIQSIPLWLATRLPPPDSENAKKNRISIEQFHKFQHLYDYAFVMFVYTFILCTIQCIRKDKEETLIEGSNEFLLIQYILHFGGVRVAGFLLIGIAAFVNVKTYSEIGHFGYFFSDFFIHPLNFSLTFLDDLHRILKAQRKIQKKQKQAKNLNSEITTISSMDTLKFPFNRPHLSHTGIFRFLNHPVAYLGTFYLYGLSLISLSLDIIMVAISKIDFWICPTFIFVNILKDFHQSQNHSFSKIFSITNTLHY